MHHKKIIPWRSQDQFGFSQAIEAAGAQRTLYCAGQTSSDAEGRPLHAGDMAAQIRQAFDNLEAVLKAAGFELGNVVRLNYYTTDVDAMFAAYQTVTDRLATAGCQPASTLLGVQRLAFPEFMIEIEATAVR